MHSQKQSGFTLVEIMIVVVIVGLLATIAIPAFRKTQMAAQNSRLANDLRVFAGQIQIFTLETGNYPEDSTTGEIPTGLEEYINIANWTAGPSIGGQFDVEYDDSNILSGVGVVGFNANDEQLRNFEMVYDDGNFDSGQYQKISGTRYYYVIAE
ncbi:MAG: prepilin-type N-terminal cleavage/methylation domain-containing protein [Verrucomicrobiota bacterium]